MLRMRNHPFACVARQRLANPTAAHLAQAYLVARRFYRDVDIKVGDELTFAAHVGDRGYQCTAAFAGDAAAVCGQLPQEIAAAMEPLVATALVATATVTLLPKHPASPVPILLTLAPPKGKRAQSKLPPAERAARQRAIDDLVRAAQATEGSISEGAGAALRRHYAAMLDAAFAADDHLFDEADRAVGAAVRGAPPPAQGLLLRLCQRKGPWFRVGALSYADVGDCDAAVAELEERKLLDVLRPESALSRAPLACTSCWPCGCLAQLRSNACWVFCITDLLAYCCLKSCLVVHRCSDLLLATPTHFALHNRN
jgi:hypothetical protein